MPDPLTPEEIAELRRIWEAERARADATGVTLVVALRGRDAFRLLDEIERLRGGERCNQCGNVYPQVYKLPDEVWALIHERAPAGLLCPVCALGRCAAEIERLRGENGKLHSKLAICESALEQCGRVVGLHAERLRRTINQRNEAGRQLRDMRVERDRYQEEYGRAIKALNVALFHLDNPEARQAEGEEDIDGARAVLRMGLEQRAALAHEEAPDA